MCKTVSDHQPALQPGESWTPATAAAFIAMFEIDVAAEVAWLQDEMQAAFPLGTQFTYVYSPEQLMQRSPHRGDLDAQLVAFVQLRTTGGAIHSALILVLWETGEIEVRGWPIEAESGWVVP